MKKELLLYRLEQNQDEVRIFKNGKSVAIVVMGIVSALEAIFVHENYTKKDWLIYEDEKVFLVDREEHKIKIDSEELERVLNAR